MIKSFIKSNLKKYSKANYKILIDFVKSITNKDVDEFLLVNDTFDLDVLDFFFNLKSNNSDSEIFRLMDCVRFEPPICYHEMNISELRQISKFEDNKVFVEMSFSAFFANRNELYNIFKKCCIIMVRKGKNNEVILKCGTASISII